MQDSKSTKSQREAGLALSAITIYCVCDDLLRAMGHRDDRQCRLSCAEVMMVPLLAALCFGGNVALCRIYLFESGAWKHSLSRSRFSRRLHQVPREAWALLQEVLGGEFSEESVNPNQIYIVDSMSVDVCSPVRATRSRLFAHEENRLLWGYCASKKRYVYGFKLQLVVKESGAPVRWVILAASQSDLCGFRHLDLTLPLGATLLGMPRTGMKGRRPTGASGVRLNLLQLSEPMPKIPSIPRSRNCSRARANGWRLPSLSSTTNGPDDQEPFLQRLLSVPQCRAACL